MDIVVIDQQMMLQQLWESLKAAESIQDNRERNNVIWKHAFSVAAMEQTSLSLQRIGAVLGKNHATILHANKQHEANYTYDIKYRMCYEKVSGEMYKLMESYDEEVRKALRSRSTIVNPSLNKLEADWERKLERVKRKEAERYANLENELKIVRAALRQQQARAELLHEELKRVKNLI